MIKFICDVGSNHNKDLDRIAKLIDTAKAIGCDAIKFQLYKAEHLYAPEFADKIEAARAGELPVHFIGPISNMCRRAGLEFHCTPFHVLDVFTLRAYVDAFKIASYSILDLTLITAVARQGLPVGLSTGGATDGEVAAAQGILRHEIVSRKITTYACSPLYPAPVYAGMMRVVTYRGYSDHTRRPAAILAAIAGGAHSVEFHLDLDDERGVETEIGHVWTATDAGDMITGTREFDMLINGTPSAESKPDYTEMRKWRNDPDDEMRPVTQYREELKNDLR